MRRINNLFCCTQYKIKVPKKDWWFCTVLTLLCKINTSWSRVVKDDIEFHTFHFMALQVKVCAESTISFGVHTNNKGTKRDWWFCTHLPTRPWNWTLSFTTLLQRLMIWHKSVCIVQNQQSLLVPCIKLYIFFHFMAL